MTNLRFGSVSLVALMFGIAGADTANAETFQFYVVDVCTTSNKGSQYPNVSYISNFCAGGSDECASGSSTLWTYISNSSYKGRCLRAKLYFKLENDSGGYTTEQVYSSDNGSSGYVVICFKTTDNDLCPKVQSCASSYYGAAQDHKIILDENYYGYPVNGDILTGYTDNFECCQTCTGYTGWATDGTICEKTMEQSCSNLGVCGTRNVYRRCAANYYPANTGNLNGPLEGSTSTVYGCASHAGGLKCTACPTTDSDWSGMNGTASQGRSPAGSTSYTACYEYQSNAALGCDSGEVRRYAVSATTYALAASVYEPVIADSNQYVDTSGEYPVCHSCPPTEDTFTTSSGSTFVSGKSDYNSSQSIPITQCYLNSGTTYYDSKGAFTLGSKCYYDESASSDLL